MNLTKFPSSVLPSFDELLFVPPKISVVYDEAAEVISISPRASAVLSRCCAELVFAQMGYTGNLQNAVALATSETSISNSLSAALRQMLPYLRYIGNAAAHPNSGGPQEIEFEDAEWCLEILYKLLRETYEDQLSAEAKMMAYEGQLLRSGVKKTPV